METFFITLALVAFAGFVVFLFVIEPRLKHWERRRPRSILLMNVWSECLSRLTAPRIRLTTLTAA